MQPAHACSGCYSRLSSAALVLCFPHRCALHREPLHAQRFVQCPLPFLSCRIAHACTSCQLQLAHLTCAACPLRARAIHHAPPMSPKSCRCALQARTPGRRFDFIKLDIEGYEAHLLNDTASIAALCRATCLIAELHDFLQLPGVGNIQAAWDSFVAVGCGAEGAFEELHKSGEHVVACKKHPRP